jgi:hypothetical protein
METASLGGWLWRPDAHEGVVPRGLSISTVPSLPWTGVAPAARCALSFPGPAVIARNDDEGRAVCWE